MFEEQFIAERKRKPGRVTVRTLFESLRKEGAGTMSDIMERFGLTMESYGKVWNPISVLLDAQMIHYRCEPNGRKVYIANRGVGLVDLDEYLEHRRLGRRSGRDVRPDDGWREKSMVKRANPAIIEALKASSVPLGTTAVGKLVNMKRQICSRHLRRLYSDGLVEYFCGQNNEYTWSARRNELVGR